MKEVITLCIVALSIVLSAGCHVPGGSTSLAHGTVSAGAEQEHFTNTTTSVDRLAKEFRALTAGAERMEFAIRLIDKGTINIGTRIDEVRTIFGNCYIDWGGAVSGEQGGTVYLADEPSKPPVDDMGTQLPTGWWMAVYYGKHGKITAYYLSNLWKLPGMVERWKAIMQSPVMN